MVAEDRAVLQQLEACLRPQPSHALVMLVQADFVVAFLGVTLSRAVAAPLNAAYREVLLC